MRAPPEPVGSPRWTSYSWPGSAKRARSSVAPNARPVRDPRLRGDAPADAGQPRRAALSRPGSSAGPTSDALAAASPAEVIREWQGLGYNRRGAEPAPGRRDVAEHGWPDDLTELPGVGPYTAAAVRAFALGDAVLPRRHERAPDRGADRPQLRPRPADRRSWTSDARSASRACRAATSARSPSSARPAAGATSRSASSRLSRARSASGARRCCGSSPIRRARSRSSTREAVEALERDGLVASRTNGHRPATG